MIERLIYDTGRFCLMIMVDDEPDAASPPPVLRVFYDGKTRGDYSLEEAQELGRLLVAVPLLDRLHAEAERVAEATANAAGDQEALEEADQFVNAIAEGRFPGAAS